MLVDINEVYKLLRHWADEYDNRPGEGTGATALLGAISDLKCHFPDPDKCSECGGSGEKAYGSTATFTGGIGGQMITSGVCNKCWGSGDSKNPWKGQKVK